MGGDGAKLKNAHNWFSDYDNNRNNIIQEEEQGISNLKYLPFDF